MQSRARYVRSGDVAIAYRVFGDGPFDVVYHPGIVSHVELMTETPTYQGRTVEALASFARVIVFDQRGVGMSDRISGTPGLEARMDDVRAVMDAAGSSRAAILSASIGVPTSLLFAATYPERTSALVLVRGFARNMWAPDVGLDSGTAACGGGGVAAPLLRVPPRGRGEARRGQPAVQRRRPRVPAACGGQPRHDRHVRDDRQRRRRQERPGGRAGADPDRPPRRGPDVSRRRRPLHGRADSRGDAGRGAGQCSFHRTRARRGRAVPVRCAGEEQSGDAGAGAGAGAGDHPVHGHRRLQRACGLARRPGLASAARPPPRARPPSALALSGPRGEHHRRRLRRQLRRPGTRDPRACAIAESMPEPGLQIRAGLHTGECELVDGQVAGIAVHIGARVAAQAQASEVLVSSTVKDLVAGSQRAFEDRGSPELKGVPGEWHLFAADPVSARVP